MIWLIKISLLRFWDSLEAINDSQKLAWAIRKQVNERSKLQATWSLATSFGYPISIEFNRPPRELLLNCVWSTFQNNIGMQNYIISVDFDQWSRKA